MKKNRNIFSVIAVIMIVINLAEINYADLGWKENKSAYLGMISMFFLLLSMILSNREKKKKEANK